MRKVPRQIEHTHTHSLSLSLPLSHTLHTYYYYSLPRTNLRLVVMREVPRKIEDTIDERFDCRVAAARYQRVERPVLRVCVCVMCAYVLVCVMCVVTSSRSMCRVAAARCQRMQRPVLPGEAGIRAYNTSSQAGHTGIQDE
jgi:hypothetical protein